LEKMDKHRVEGRKKNKGKKGAKRMMVSLPFL
jgi:hypothetical protein